MVSSSLQLERLWPEAERERFIADLTLSKATALKWKPAGNLEAFTMLMSPPRNLGTSEPIGCRRPYSIGMLSWKEPLGLGNQLSLMAKKAQLDVKVSYFYHQAEGLADSTWYYYRRGAGRVKNDRSITEISICTVPRTVQYFGRANLIPYLGTDELLTPDGTRTK